MLSTDDHSKLGKYSPDIPSKVAILLARKTILGRGDARQLLRRLLVRQTGGVIDYTLWGQPFRAYLQGNLSEWKAFMSPDLYDPHERAVIKEAIDRPNAVFVDIGANVGIFTLFAIANAREDTRILAFEPHPETFRRLQFNLAHSPHTGVRAFQVALSDHDGTATISGSDLSLMSLNGSALGVEVRARRLQNLLLEEGIGHIDALKIDVEGAEDVVLGPFLDNAPDELLPRRIVIETLGRPHWRFDCMKSLEQRGFERVAEVGNNTIMKLRQH